MALTYPQNGDLTKSLKSGRQKVPQSARLSAGGGCKCYLGNAHMEVLTSGKGLPLVENDSGSTQDRKKSAKLPCVYVNVIRGEVTYTM